ncbi:MAG: lipopolysaccharide kinase InaA family protein [Candidatus Freyarchaeota archaeon]|nr:lipopolysaccharide kinase InaA family protein [Candidatus Freyrarchaeum guaymaensis]
MRWRRSLGKRGKAALLTGLEVAKMPDFRGVSSPPLEGLPPSFIEIPIVLNGLADRVNFFTEFSGLLGVKGEVVYVEVKPLGTFINEVDMVSVTTTKGSYRFVLKSFSSWGLFKWFPLWVASYARANFSISGKSRLKNELRARLILERLGVNTPNVYCYDLKRAKALYEFIDAENLDEIVKEARREDKLDELAETYMMVGREVSRIHNAGYVLGDCKPANILYVEEKKQTYYIDLEQARVGDRKLSGWDVCEFVMFTGRFFILPRKAKEICEAFLQGYSEQGEKRVLREAASVKMAQPFVGMVSPVVLQALRALIADYAQ